jgi:hypothetical protein
MPFLPSPALGAGRSRSRRAVAPRLLPRSNRSCRFPPPRGGISRHASGFAPLTGGDGRQDWSDTLANAAQILAILIGGGWALWKFGLNREEWPRATLEQVITPQPLDDQHSLLRLLVGVKNAGSVLIDIEEVRVDVYRVLPLADETKQALDEANSSRRMKLRLRGRASRPESAPGNQEKRVSSPRRANLSSARSRRRARRWREERVMSSEQAPPRHPPHPPHPPAPRSRRRGRHERRPRPPLNNRHDPPLRKNRFQTRSARDADRPGPSAATPI